MADSIQLKWDVPEDVKIPHNYSDKITHYNVYRGTNEENIPFFVSTNNTTFKDIQITISSQYIYKVTAVHEGSTESVSSNEIRIQTMLTTPSGLTYEESLRFQPPPPRNLSGSFVGDSIQLKWDVPENVKIPHNYSSVISHYNIYRGTSEENMSYFASTSNLFYKDSNISKGQKYIYEVTAIHESSTESVPSNDIIIP